MKSQLAPLSSVDHMLLMTEKPRAPQHIGGLWIVQAGPLLDAEGGLDLEMIKRRLQQRLVRVPELRRVVKRTPLLCGRPVWVDDANFSIESQSLVEIPVRRSVADLRQTLDPGASRS